MPTSFLAPLRRDVHGRRMPSMSARTHAASAVSGSTAELHEGRFGLSVHIVRDANGSAISGSANRSSARSGWSSGAAIPGRNLEGMITTVLQFDEEYTLDLPG